MTKEWKEGALAGYRGDVYKNPYFSVQGEWWHDGYKEGAQRRYLDDIAVELRISLGFKK